MNRRLKNTVVIFFLVCSILSGLFFSPLTDTAVATWWNTDWNYRKTITIDHNYIDTDLVDFTFLVEIPSSVAANCQANGEDIRFVSNDNVTTFKYEIEEWNASSNSYVWVKVSDVINATSTDYEFNLYYNNSEAPAGQDVENAWDSNYKQVQHFNETSGTHYDSTSNDEDSTDISVTKQGNASGVVSGCDEFDDAFSDYVDFSTIGDFNTYTVELWLYTHDTGNEQVWGRNSYQTIGANSPTAFDINFDFLGVDVSTSDDRLTDNTWHYIVGTHNGSYGMLYFNTSYVGNGACTSNLNFAPSIGCRANGGHEYHMDGLIDEYRVSDIARNSSWINATFHSINQSTGFLTFGATESYAVFPPTNFIVRTDSKTQINLTWTVGVNSTYTRIQRKIGSYPTLINDGTNVYNGTGTNYDDTVTEYTHYYYSAWGYNTTLGRWSATKVNGTNNTGPTNPTDIDIAVSGNNINISWTKGERADYTRLQRSIGSYPTGPDNGTNLYNDTGTYNVSILDPSYYCTLYSFNISTGYFSSGTNVEWGTLMINCYNENNLSTNLTFDVKISNPSGSQVYENIGCTNIHIVDLDLCPQGNNIQIIISATDYQQRVYTLDIYANEFYLLNTYLPPVTPPGGGIDCTQRPYVDSVTVTDPNSDLTINLTHSLEIMINVEIYNESLYVTYGGWHFVSNDKYTYTTTQVIINNSVLDANTTMARANYYYLYCEESVESALYNIYVMETIRTEYTSYNQGVENALVTIKRYFSEISNYTIVSSLLTDANGYINLYFIPHIDYKVFVTKTEYNETISSYIPQPPNQYGQTETKTFRLIRIGGEYEVPPVNTIYLNITYAFQPVGTRHTSIFTFYYNITSNDCQLQWYRMEVWYYNDTTDLWVLLSEQNKTDICGGSISYTIPNVTGKYVFKCYYKKVDFDEYEIGETGSLIHFFVLVRAGLESVPDYAWFIITIIIMIVSMGFCIRYFATGIATGYVGLGIFAMMLMLKDFEVPLGGTGDMISGWLILGITFLMYTMGVFLWSRI